MNNLTKIKDFLSSLINNKSQQSLQKIQNDKENLFNKPIDTNYFLTALDSIPFADNSTIEFFTHLNDMYNHFSYQQLVDYQQELKNLKPQEPLLNDFQRILDLKKTDNEFFAKYPQLKPNYYNNT